MPKLDSKRRGPAATLPAALVVLLACLTLAACGSSSSTASSSTAAKTTGTPAATTGGNRTAFAGRFKALRECLQKNGVTLPNRTPGQGPGGGARGPLGGGAGNPPPGVSRVTYEAALKKCGGPPAGGRGRTNSPAFRKALTTFAACMRENGVDVPAPNTSGTGPVFNTKGLSTTSATFKAAQSKCSSLLRGGLPHAG